MPRLIATPELKKARLEKGTQEEFVGVIKIYRPELNLKAYTKYETGARTISIEMAQTMANLLNKRIHKLFKPAEQKDGK